MVSKMEAGVYTACGFRRPEHNSGRHGRRVLAGRPVHVGDGGDAGVGEHPASLLGRFLAMREPEGLVPVCCSHSASDAPVLTVLPQPVGN